MFKTVDDCIYVGECDILSIKKKKLYYENESILEDIVKIPKVPIEAELDNEVDYWWIGKYYFKKNTEKKLFYVCIKDLGNISLEDGDLLYQTHGVIIDKRSENMLKITYEPSNFLNAYTLIYNYINEWDYISIIDNNNNHVSFYDKISFLFWLSSNRNISILFKNEKYVNVLGLKITLIDKLI